MQSRISVGQDMQWNAGILAEADQFTVLRPGGLRQLLQRRILRQTGLLLRHEMRLVIPSQRSSFVVIVARVSCFGDRRRECTIHTLRCKTTSCVLALNGE